MRTWSRLTVSDVHYDVCLIAAAAHLKRATASTPVKPKSRLSIFDRSAPIDLNKKKIEKRKIMSAGKRVKFSNSPDVAIERIGLAASDGTARNLLRSLLLPNLQLPDS